MSKELDALSVPTPEEFTFTPEYRGYIESMLPVLRSQENSNVIAVSHEDRFLYQFDLEGFLLANNVPIEDHYLIMRVNNIDDSYTFQMDVEYLVVPDLGLINRIKSLFKGKMLKT